MASVPQARAQETLRAGAEGALRHNAWLHILPVVAGLGAFAALVPKAVLIMIGIFAALVIAFRYVSLASMVAAAALPALIYVLYVGKGWGGPINDVLAAALAASAIIIAKHHANISRLLAGTEHRFSLPFGTIRNETKTL